VSEFFSARLIEGAVGIVIAAAVLLVARRLAGAFHVPLTTAAAAGVCISGLIALAPLGIVRRAKSIASLTIPIGLVVIAASLTLPGSGAATIAALWLPAVIALVGTFAGRRANIRPLRRQASNTPAPQPFDVSTSSVTRRFVDAAGVDCFEATYRAECPADGRFAVVHAVFQPPFATVPEVEAVLEGQDRAPGVQLRTTLVLPYGARIEVRYASTASAARVARVRLKARGLQSCDNRSA